MLFALTKENNGGREEEEEEEGGGEEKEEEDLTIVLYKKYVLTVRGILPVSYTHLTLPTTPYV